LIDPAMGMKRFTSQRRTPTTIKVTTICIKGMICLPPFSSRQTLLAYSAALRHWFLLIGLVVRRLLVQSGKEQFRRGGRVDRTIDDDVIGAYSLPVSLPLPSPSGRSVEPSREIPATIRENANTKEPEPEV
jgi:hypothetical protein